MEAPPLGQKYGQLAMLLVALRHDLDIYSLVTANFDSIERIGLGRNFFAHIQRLAIEAICLNICKLFETEKKKRNKYELNSIQGVLNQLSVDQAGLRVWDAIALEAFVQNFGERKITEDWLSDLKLTISRFRSKFNKELERLNTFRDKVVAHSEYGVNIQDLPSYDVMEDLFMFEARFYELITRTFLGGIPFDLKTETHVKSSLESVLRRYGVDEISTI